ncbi:MAG: hypothetical protein ACPGVT_08185 [Maricaulaceae bacterium]
MIAHPPHFNSLDKNASFFHDFYFGKARNYNAEYFNSFDTSSDKYGGITHRPEWLSAKICHVQLSADNIEDAFKQKKNRDYYRKNYVLNELESSRLEALGSIAVRDKKWDDLKDAIASIDTTLDKFDYISDNRDPLSPQIHLVRRDVANHFKLLNLKYYFSGVLALSHDNKTQTFSHIQNLLDLGIDFYFRPEANMMAQRSHSYNKQIRTVFVLNNLLIMDLTRRTAETPGILTVEKEHIFRHVMYASRHDTFYDGGTVDMSNMSRFAPENIDHTREWIGGLSSPQEGTDNLGLLLPIFEVALFDFRRYWPYDYGPFLWKHVAQQQSDFSKSLVDLDKDEEKYTAYFCKAERLKYSLGMTVAPNCAAP